MDVYSIVSTVITVVLGGGWFVYYKANKRIKEGEATISEASGWAKQQEVYQTTIKDQQTYYEHLKADFNVVIEENTQLRKENNELRAKVNDLENAVCDLKKEVSRLGRKMEALSTETKKPKKSRKLLSGNN